MWQGAESVLPRVAAGEEGHRETERSDQRRQQRVMMHFFWASR